ncbi:GntR family transcriptional regulator [Streptomyces lincolnensis]|uniref:GntR family transcriptional regulator n=1 Tax=Streptomyces lincolnensis TaxID=1915 RepID=UPI00082AC6DD|nr:winged helix-turn-helix domain-containing protein [Streptomyces lincolnensis]AXG54070.1 GntR family transcriptional regulator [Streptomyces lincolnensis]QMV08450.1 GntR family transcriptional regulator [Streptomyces lincolnensis]
MVVTQENVAVNGSRRLSPQEIADTLRDRIRAGDLRAGDRLPTQAELAEEFGVERGTVRQALRALQEDGLLSNVSKGSPPRIAEPPRTGRAEEPQPTMVGLAPRLVEAFTVPHVRVDAACLTAETLMLALGEPIRHIHEGRIRPDSIDVRILLPSRDISLAFPVPVDGRGDDDPVHQRWLDMRNAQSHVLRHNLRALRSSHGIDVHVSFRALPFTPPVKLYLLNGEEALIAYYMVTRREEASDSGVLDMYDVLGTESLLFSFEKGTGQRDAAFVEQSQKWFDALWETITTDLTLS